MSTPVSAQMITPDRSHDSAPLLRKQFALDAEHGALVTAELLATALGVCEVSVNGQSVSADLLTPGWSSYEYRLRYANWDVTDLIAEQNVVGVLLGNGWHTGHLGWSGARAVYGPDRAALIELRLTFADGHTQLVGTDESWQSGPSHVLADDLYNGQTIDAGKIDTSWARPGSSPAGWSGVRALDFDHDRLTPYVGPPVRRQDEMKPREIWTSPAGATLVDFGQNLVGWIRVATTGQRGQTLTLRHAEVLDNSELGTRPLRLAEATDRYILSGGADVFEPTLTFHGFRYAQVDGWTGSLDELHEALTAVVIGSELRRTGTFESSDPLLNRLHENIVWGMRGNFVDVPSDCPQRDERLGWTGDLAAFIDTAVYLYDVDSFLRDWLLDLGAEQSHADGRIPVIVPDNLKYEEMGALAAIMGSSLVIALWNDAACWVPWSMYEACGDTRVLSQQYDSMASHVRRIEGALSPRDLLESGFQLGDWLDPTAPPDAPHEGKADASVVATACVYRSAIIARDSARLLGHEADADEFDSIATRLRTAFTTHYVRAGRIQSDAPAVYSLAICFGIVEGRDLFLAGNRLAALVADGDYRINTGFAGTPFILTALSETGHLDTAYRLLLQKECPSWLYPVTMGATTMWERWDSMLPDGSINPGEMTSFNHYAFGAVGAWMHRVVAGLQPAEPGYRRLRIAPQPPREGLTSARATLDTPHGVAESAWNITNGEFTLEVTVPAGTSAEVALPSGERHEAEPGNHRWVEPFEPRAEKSDQTALDSLRAERAATEELEAKAAMLSGASFWSTKQGEGIRSLLLVDGPHGLRYQDGEEDHLGVHDSQPATCFPPSVALGSSWDPSLARAVGEAIGREARSLGVDVVLGPGINIKRSPLGGRTFEYFSEDPHLTGALGAEWVHGLQSTGVGASLKHFAANNQETDRMSVSADIDERTLREIYLSAFERIVTEAEPATVMTAYNAINGVFASENSWLLTELLRDDWGFEGVVVSDWGAVKDRVEGLRAGLDLEMPASGDGGTRAIVDAVAAGTLSAEDVERSVERLRRLADRTASEARPPVDYDAHHALARRAGAESVVLLRNEGNTLPLRAGTSVAVVGTLAVDPQFQGGGSSHVNPTRVDVPLDALRDALGAENVVYATGYSRDSPSATLVEEALAAASAAEVAVVFAGLYESDQSEGFDRKNLDLPADQVALISAVAAVAPRTVVVLMNGGVVSLEPWHDSVDAIVEGWALGQAIGGALADVLTGVVSPSGRLAETIPLALADTPSYLSFPGEQGHSRYGEGVFVGYRYYTSTDRAVRYPFGHGLSYTAFSYDDFDVTATGQDTAIARVTVTNSGDVRGADVVQIYIAPGEGAVRRPIRELGGFAKVWLEPGESRVVEIDLPRRAFAYWDIRSSLWLVVGGARTVQLAASANDIIAEVVVNLPGDNRRPSVLSLDSTVGQWFAHPVVGPALLQLMAADAPDSNTDAIKLVESMPMGQFARFVGGDIPESVLNHFIALSVDAASGEND